MKQNREKGLRGKDDGMRWPCFICGLLMSCIVVALWVGAKPIFTFLSENLCVFLLAAFIPFVIISLAIGVVRLYLNPVRALTPRYPTWLFPVSLIPILLGPIFYYAESPNFNPYISNFLVLVLALLLLMRRLLGRRTFAHAARYFLLIMLAIIFLLPFYWMFVNSLKSFSEIFAAPTFLPKSWRWDNYSEIFRNPQLPFGRYFRNTFIIAIVATLGQLISCSIVAYAFARIRFKGREFLFLIVLATMMVPFQVTMIPLFIGFKFLNEHHFLGLMWLNSMLPIIVPQLFATAFNVFLLRQFFRTIPYELDEAAHIDGCSKFGIYWRVILPLSRPALIIVGLFTFFWNWKDLMGPLVYFNARDNTTVSLGLMFLKNPKHIDWQLIMAASTISLIPVVILFFIGQRYIIRGITMTGIKA